MRMLSVGYLPEDCSSLVDLVPRRGLEPARVLPHSDLNAARLPVPPRPLATVNIVAHIETMKRTQGL